MSAYHGFIPFPQQAAGELHPGGVGLFRGGLAGGVGMDDVIAQYAALLVPAALGCPHILIGAGGVTVDAGDELAGLGGVSRIGQGAFQAGLFLVQRVVHAMVQPTADGDDLVIGHYKVSFTSRHASYTRAAALRMSASDALFWRLAQWAI